MTGSQGQEMPERGKDMEAEKMIAEAAGAGDRGPGEPPTVRELAERWLVELRPIRKKSTISKYEGQFTEHIYPVFGRKRLDSITNTDVISFANGLLSEKKLSPRTVSDILSRLNSIRKYALIHGYHAGYMPDCVEIQKGQREIRVLSFSEEGRLVRYLKDRRDLTSLGILICLFTGIRVGELCALRWSDVSFEEHEIHVCRTMQRIQGRDARDGRKTHIEIGAPKSGCSRRVIPIPDNIMDDLSRARTGEGYVLTGESRRYVEPRTMQNRFKEILKACGISDANFHALRHTFATRCVEAGFDTKSLSEILGHASVSLTLNNYVHPTMWLKHENMKKLSDLFSEGQASR